MPVTLTYSLKHTEGLAVVVWNARVTVTAPDDSVLFTADTTIDTSRWQYKMLVGPSAGITRPVPEGGLTVDTLALGPQDPDVPVAEVYYTPSDLVQALWQAGLTYTAAWAKKAADWYADENDIFTLTADDLQRQSVSNTLLLLL